MENIFDSAKQFKKTHNIKRFIKAASNFGERGCYSYGKRWTESDIRTVWAHRT